MCDPNDHSLRSAFSDVGQEVFQHLKHVVKVQQTQPGSVGGNKLIRQYKNCSYDIYGENVSFGTLIARIFVLTYTVTLLSV